MRSLEKLKRIVEFELEKAGCQKLSLPLLTSGNLWETTGYYFGTLFRYLEHVACTITQYTCNITANICVLS